MPQRVILLQNPGQIVRVQQHLIFSTVLVPDGSLAALTYYNVFKIGKVIHCQSLSFLQNYPEVEANFGAKTQHYLIGLWFNPPSPPPLQKTECKVPTKPPSCCFTLSQVTTRVLAFQAPDYGCMVGMCVQLMYRLHVMLVCYSNAGQVSFLNSFVFIVSVCDSVQQLLGALHLLRPSKLRTGLVAGPMLDLMPLDSVHLHIRIQICTKIGRKNMNKCIYALLHLLGSTCKLLC